MTGPCQQRFGIIASRTSILRPTVRDLRFFRKKTFPTCTKYSSQCQEVGAEVCDRLRAPAVRNKVHSKSRRKGDGVLKGSHDPLETMHEFWKLVRRVTPETLVEARAVDQLLGGPPRRVLSANTEEAHAWHSLPQQPSAEKRENRADRFACRVII